MLYWSIFTEEVNISKSYAIFFYMDESAFFVTSKRDRILPIKGDKTVYAVSSNSDRKAVTFLMNVSAGGTTAPQ